MTMSLTGDAGRRKKITSGAKTPDVSVASKPEGEEHPHFDPRELLGWYERHRRSLPWRAPPGAKADPYRVWLSEIMLQQTSVKAVEPYYARFLDRFPTVERLAAAPLADVLKVWAGLGYYARARNLHACARIVVEQHDGHFPQTESRLRELPGVGSYTASAIAAIAFDRRASPVDGNVERVVARLYAVAQPLPQAKPVIRRLAAALTPQRRAGDFAQAIMDLGATICTPKRPACIRCPWHAACLACRRGDQERFPRRTPKAEGRLRRGAAYVAVRADGFVLLRTRPENGLLGGMSEVPTSAWTPDFDLKRPLDAAPRVRSARGRGVKMRWCQLAGTVTHTFTHFPLALTVYRAAVRSGTPAPDGMRWVGIGELDGEALPNVMRKVLGHARCLPAPKFGDTER